MRRSPFNYYVVILVELVNFMANFGIVYTQVKDIDSKKYADILPQAKAVLADAKPDDVVMLQIKINSPKVITKALPLSEENLLKISQIE
jgi:predicted nucleic acid-binding protein